MTATHFASAVLCCSATSSQPAVQRIEARVESQQHFGLVFSYLLHGHVDQLLIPHAAMPRRIDGLWQHSCFEAFVGREYDPGYYEFNFSPSGEWAAYRFRAYRDGGAIDDEALVPSISTERLADRLTLNATVRLDCLPLIEPCAALRVGLSAVIEAADGTLSYWALKHPGEKPDFHHPDSFALELALPGDSA